MAQTDDQTTVTIVFKSGAKVRMECDEFKLTKRLGEGISGLTIRSPDPRNVFIDLREIAAVFEGEA